MSTCFFCYHNRLALRDSLCNHAPDAVASSVLYLSKVVAAGITHFHTNGMEMQSLALLAGIVILFLIISKTFSQEKVTARKRDKSFDAS